MNSIDKGIEFLDASGPADWWDLIDLETFNIVSGYDCVLGQVFAAEAAEQCFATGYDMNLVLMGTDWITDHAFCVNDEFMSFAALHDAWVEAILERRAMVNA